MNVFSRAAGVVLPRGLSRWLALFTANRRFLKKLIGPAGFRLVRGGASWAAARIALKEIPGVEACLDYPHRPIRMVVQSHKELRRLLACSKEPETVRWLEEALGPGEVFYDVGANVGAYSFVAWARTEGRATVYAFEPAFANFAALSYNVFLNGCGGTVIPLCAALGDKTGLAELLYSSVEAGHAFHALSQAQAGEARPAGFRQAVPVWRLDDLGDRLGIKTPNHIKIDVDGSELAVIRGAAETLRRDQLRSILVEIDESGPAGREVRQRIQGAGFKVVSRHPKKERRGLPPSANYIFRREQ